MFNVRRLTATLAVSGAVFPAAARNPYGSAPVDLTVRKGDLC